MIDSNKTNSPLKVEFEEEKKEMIVQEEYTQFSERVEDPKAKIFEI